MFSSTGFRESPVHWSPVTLPGVGWWARRWVFQWRGRCTWQQTEEDGRSRPSSLHFPLLFTLHCVPQTSYESRRRRHLWRRKREEILYKYYEFNCHATAVSLVNPTFTRKAWDNILLTLTCPLEYHIRTDLNFFSAFMYEPRTAKFSTRKNLNVQ